MACIVSARFDDCADSLFGDGEEGVGGGGGLDGVDGHLDGAVCSILEADGHRETRCQLAVHLTFRSPCTNGTPADQVGIVLRSDRVKPFCSSRQAEVVDLEEETAGQAEALVDVEGTGQVRVVDEAFPAYGGAGLFEVDAHDDV